MRGAFLAVWLAAALATAGCAGRQQLAYDREFLQLNAARDAARAAKDGATAESAETAMARLAKEARAAAEAAQKDKRPLDAIALYRVAASAVWKSGEDGVVATAKDGLDVCDTLPEGHRGAPRDCVFLRMVGPMAVIDRHARQIAEYGATWQQLAPTRRRSEAETMRDGALAIVRQTLTVNEIRRDIDTPLWAKVLPAGMIAYMDEQLRRGYCQAYRASGLLLLREEFTQLRAAVDAARNNTKLRDDLARRFGWPADDSIICKEILR